MIRKQNDDVDEVSIGTIIIIIGLLFILFTPVFSDFFYIPREITGYEDKTTRIGSNISQFTFISIGILTIFIGCCIFFRNFMNITIDYLVDKWNKKKRGQ
ncbi:MAG: hypothetical protein HF976_05725 [ANME-2 cluster archaeon]|nr:hypothetical protein [ANME-2 cluster archaeon]MBC2700902.1 hypothetical protein [ANME-2 cluster archaeon]MBC2709245.1 hypothetical protein [ANME-2 cluster archaeon]MBC2745444.1 hypothetical protein [ANME-2 cluster archaeon]MBC2763064.1 hypothetical protein [ANME-2 cluster archaeon]